MLKKQINIISIWNASVKFSAVFVQQIFHFLMFADTCP